MKGFYEPGATPRIFLATPITSIATNEDHDALVSLAHRFVSSATTLCPKAEVRCELLQRVGGDYESPDVAVAEDFGAISSCTHFVLVYPKPLATSALMELGYAMAMDVPCLIYTDDAEGLPYLARPTGGTGPGETVVLPYAEYGVPSEGLQSFLRS